MKKESKPWLPIKYELADVSAVQAVSFGTATPEQQKRAAKWIIEMASGFYDLSFYPGGEDGRRNTDFAEGRRFVGAQILKMQSLDLALLKRSIESDPPSE